MPKSVYVCIQMESRIVSPSPTPQVYYNCELYNTIHNPCNVRNYIYILLRGNLIALLYYLYIDLDPVPCGNVHLSDDSESLRSILNPIIVHCRQRVHASTSHKASVGTQF